MTAMQDPGNLQSNLGIELYSAMLFIGGVPSPLIHLGQKTRTGISDSGI